MHIATSQQIGVAAPFTTCLELNRLKFNEILMMIALPILNVLSLLSRAYRSRGRFEIGPRRSRGPVSWRSRRRACPATGFPDLIMRPWDDLCLYFTCLRRPGLARVEHAWFDARLGGPSLAM